MRYGILGYIKIFLVEVKRLLTEMKMIEQNSLGYATCYIRRIFSENDVGI